MRIYGSAVLDYMFDELLAVEKVALVGKLLVAVRLIISAAEVYATNLCSALF